MEHYKRDMKLTTELAELINKQSDLVLQIQDLLLTYADGLQKELQLIAKDIK